MPDDPVFSYANLKAYYLDRSRSLWPAGICPPLEAYGVLQQLWQECDAAMAQAESEARTISNVLAQLPSTADDTALRAVEARRSAAAMIANSLKTDMNLLEMRARDRGITL
jgi:hypothetical protein